MKYQLRYFQEHETRLVSWVSEIVEEGRSSGYEDLVPGTSSSTDSAYLAFATVKLWAHLIKGNSQWAILKIIGESLDMYADLCRERHLSHNAGA